jgi:glycosyltransferase involved in cell wall biosynthesis
VAHNDLPRIYHHAYIFALPSLGDSFGQVFSEAMACGLPIIAARSGGVQGFVETGVNGFLVEPRTSKNLIPPLQKLISHADLREKMGRANFDKVKRSLRFFK